MVTPGSLPMGPMRCVRRSSSCSTAGDSSSCCSCLTASYMVVGMSIQEGSGRVECWS